MRMTLLAKTLLTVACLAAMGCASGLAPTRFTNPDFDFGFVERAAVLPLDNLSNDQQAGVRATRLLNTELLASGASRPPSRWSRSASAWACRRS